MKAFLFKIVVINFTILFISDDKTPSSFLASHSNKPVFVFETIKYSYIFMSFLCLFFLLNSLSFWFFFLCFVGVFSPSFSYHCDIIICKWLNRHPQDNFSLTYNVCSMQIKTKTPLNEVQKYSILFI